MTAPSWRRAFAACAAGLLAAGLALLPGTAAHAAAPSGFVQRDGTSFSLDGKPYRYGGTNNYYLHYSSQTMTDDVLDDARSMHLNTIRSWTFLECGSADGSVPDSNGACSQGADHWMQRWDPATGHAEYNTGANGLQKLDHLLAAASARGQKVIMVLTNNWKDFGGMDQYVTWHGLQYHDQFYTDAGIRQDYKDWAATLINRTNSVTGVKYKDDPAIFSWELANEPRCIDASLPTSGTCTKETIVDWAREMSGYIKGLDPDHMVSVGDEGFLNAGRGSDWPYNAADGVDHEALSALPDVDFGTYHLYPSSWGESNDWGTQWIKDHNTAAQGYGKPAILEEFGITDQGARDATYRTWTDTVRTGGGDGWNFWILTGVQDDGQLYPDYDGFRITYPSASATVLSDAAQAMGGGSSGGDTTPPSTPTGLKVTGTTSSSVSLSWTASTDTVGVAGYDVFSGGTKVGSADGTTYTDTGLSAATAYTYTVKARDAAGNTSAASSSVTGTTAPGGGGPTGAVKAQYKNNDSSAGDNQIKPGLRVVNTGSSALDLTKVKLRYYFTGESGAATYATWCDWAVIGCSNVTGKVVALSSPKTGADHYLEIGFSGGSLAAGANTGEIQLRFSKTDWSAFSEADDYSYGTGTGFADAAKTTAYVDGALAWGTEP